ncbi:MAG: DUF192 domain-containing protein [Deltaproteobacteria bacterium]|nr:MAG: DUF192 domain-containing protein [Deltaproteobacteria bacterium]
MRGRVVPLTDGEGGILGEALLLNTFFRRLLGLSFRRETTGAVLLVPCNSIHTFFMRFPIDAYFLSPDGEVLREVTGLVPGRVVPPVPGARMVLEVPSGRGETFRGRRRIVPRL